MSVAHWGLPRSLASAAALWVILFFSNSGAALADAVPVVSGTPPTTGTVGVLYSFKPTGRDPDGKPLVWGVSNAPSWARLNSSTGELRGTPTAAGTWSNITIVAWDGRLTGTLKPFSITVTGSGGTTNRPPVISGTPSGSARTGSAYNFRPTASDPDGNTLGFSIQNRPVWASFNTSTGQLSGTPSSSNVGTFMNIRISVSDGRATASLPQFQIVVSPGSSTPPANSPPLISGTPPTSVRVGSAYAFTPTASDPNGDTLTFSITNLPSWASFSTTTGRISGTPTAAAVGTYSNIVVRVSDGRGASAQLAAFAITVTDVVNGSATLTWTPPTTNTDGSTLTNLAGYRILYGTSASSLTQSVQVANPGTSSYVVTNLAPATWYFSVRAYTAAGSESAGSNIASKAVQ